MVLLPSVLEEAVKAVKNAVVQLGVRGNPVGGLMHVALKMK